MIIGVITFLVGALSSSSMKSARDQQAADVLVQAKDALIGRAVSDASHPGSLPCPDNSAPGSPLWGTAPGTTYSGGHCPSYIGRLPWKTLGIPELHDANGEDLWYALSPTLRDNNAAQPINSDTPGWLSLTGTITLNNVAAVIFAPGAAICGQSRSSTATANQYLETLSTISTTGPTPISVRSASNDCSNFPYNDNLLAITTDQIFQPVEKRLVREVKACLDTYAGSSANKYPWPALTSDTTYTSASGTLFGRVPTQPTINIPLNVGNTSNSKIINMLNALAAVQTAVNQCLQPGGDTNANQNALANAGTTLVNAAQAVAGAQPTAPAITSSVTNPAINAGQYAQYSNRCDNINNNGNTTVQNNLASANSALSSILVPEDPSMSMAWPTGCFIAGTYWDDWKNLVFYQVADSFRPNGTLTCANNCLSVTGSGSSATGSGSYHAVAIVSRKYISTDAPPSPPSRTVTNAAAYLEPINLLPQAYSTNIPPYNTFRPIDPSFQTVNDLVQCLDGNVNCK
ncbi:hypothetical protein [Sideroxydans sp. CL21]|uniref:hypothetical protein n=1 Tax=Sideroxydans sp. CL21 TaxID=2600596 RepID=UPI0024BC4E09|nr:hypothetical protein [Sideroxydans sp. CL21]